MNEEQLAPWVSASVAAARPASPRQRRVLLVDDDVISMEILALLLGHDGHEVMRAADGAAALDLLSDLLAVDLLSDGDRPRSPDVLLVDLQMPGLSGPEVARRVSSMPGSKPLLLAMSATAAAREDLAGFDGFLLKPLALDELRRALTTSKRRRRASADKDRARQPLPAAAAPSDAARLAGSFDSTDLIDERVLRKLQAAMPARALQELYEACIADTRMRAAQLKDQIAAGDLAGVRRTGHQIKGAASMVGLARIAELAASLELGSCKEEDTLDLLDDLLTSCEALERILLARKSEKSP